MRSLWRVCCGSRCRLLPCDPRYDTPRLRRSLAACDDRRWRVLLPGRRRPRIPVLNARPQFLIVGQLQGRRKGEKMTTQQLYKLFADGRARFCVGPDDCEYFVYTPPHNRRDLWMHRINKRTRRLARGSHARIRRSDLRAASPDDEPWQRAEREFVEQMQITDADEGCLILTRKVRK